MKNVADISVGQFLKPIRPHFSKLTIPTKNVIVTSEHFEQVLQEMYQLGQSDEAILFEKGD
jgi:coenzyme F420-reducing hydrogenase beta subunit